MRIAKIEITPELLLQMLMLPNGARFVGPRNSNQNLELLVEHSNLDEVPAGQEPPLIRPSYRKEYSDREPPRAVFVDWGKS